jgi:hypothetical protein
LQENRKLLSELEEDTDDSLNVKEDCIDFIITLELAAVPRESNRKRFNLRK